MRGGRQAWPPQKFGGHRLRLVLAWKLLSRAEQADDRSDTGQGSKLAILTGGDFLVQLSRVQELPPS